MLDAKRLQELRGLHIKQASPDGDFCRLCGSRSNDWSWPCEAMRTLDLALEAERLRAALLSMRCPRHRVDPDAPKHSFAIHMASSQVCYAAMSALAGTEAV